MNKLRKPIVFQHAANGNRVLFVSIALCSLLVWACSETPVKTIETVPETEELLSADLPNAHTVLSRSFAASRGNPGITHSGQNPETVSNGFASPLFGLTAAPNGDILVADAGAGIATIDGSTDFSLPGVTDMDPLGRSSIWAVTGAGADPTADTGQGLHRISQGRSRLIVNLFEFEQANDPDGTANPNVDSNPFDVHSLGGGAALVADAGGNDLLLVSNRGDVEVLAVFPGELVSTANLKDILDCPNPSPLCALPPELPAQAVPTSIAVGPDGYYYVGELKGFPAPAGASNIWRVAPGASWAQCGSSPDCEKVFDGGFTSIIDLAFGPDGKLYVAELDEDSWFAVEVLGGGVGGTINECDISTLSCSEVATGIPILTAITFGNDGTLWATQNALIPGLADVIEIP